MDLLKQHELIIWKVNSYMKKIKYFFNIAKFQKVTQLRAVFKNETRWSSLYIMIQRYFEADEHLKIIASTDKDSKH